MRAIQAAWCLAILAALPARAQQAPGQPDAASRAAIDRVLQQSAADWSRGDLAAFMRSYENAPQTAFVTPDGLVTGYDAIAARYAAHYQAGAGHRMGRLTLALLDQRSLGAAYVLTTGRFALARPRADGGDASGIFTLLMHATPQGWRIAYDHTS